MSKKYKLGVIGNPIEHSLSPFIHSRFARNENINIDYQAYKVEEINFSNFIKEFFSDNSAKGLNVTLPFKSLAAGLDGIISEEASFINAVNTITLVDKKIRLASTDGEGFMNDLRSKNIDVANKNILILGAGAAVESILFTLYNNNPKNISILNRTQDKAEKICLKYDDKRKVNTKILDGDYDLVINGSSAGLTGAFLPPKEIKITNKTIFYDLNYSLGDTPFCEWAIENSNLVYDGIGMLAHQAALSFDIWFGVCPNIDTVIDDLKSLKQ